MNPPDLFLMLKQETSVIHEKVMQESWAQRVMSLDYTRHEYSELLQKYYGFYLPIESQLLDFHTPVFPPSRAKHNLLQEDLSFLNLGPFFAPAICQKLPQIVDVPSALGICYVLEGATLGGQIISRHLKDSLGLKENDGLKFFLGYGSETAKMWNSFKAQARDIVRSPQESHAMLQAAIKTFSSLSDWMHTS